MPPFRDQQVNAHGAAWLTVPPEVAGEEEDRNASHRGESARPWQNVSPPLRLLPAAPEVLEGKGYGWGSIKRSLVSTPIRRYVKPLAPRLARVLLETKGTGQG